ncbi:MAG TPA: exodeoxyribonuclease VII large subunit [Polyangiales bacterium]|nr:exodeoxyribonuclease VII large subunit [Polyangiales bacterium]
MSTLPLFDRSKLGGGSGEDDTRVYRVAQLNRAVRGLLEQRWANVWVAGEISDLTLASSGHAYFTLNDEQEPAQLRVVLFKTDARRSKAKLENGARVRLQGQLSLFTPRGGYQLIARIALPEGLGEIYANFERTRQRLEDAGLLAADRKRPLPHLPRVLGVVTSRSGAALHDIIRVAHTRCPVRIVIAPCVVQGAEAPASIVRAIQSIQRLPALDVVIIGRGGGASEDLVAFNDERVARAIASCRVPTISAVGHEVDVSIADLVADVRAATPSNAAELAVPDRRALSAELRGAERGLARAAEVRLGRARLKLERLAQHLRDPRSALRVTRSRLDGSQRKLQAQNDRRMRESRAMLRSLTERLARVDPRRRLVVQRQRLVRLQSALTNLGRPLYLARQNELMRLAGRLDALSPLGSLARGYAIVLPERTGKALLRADDVSPGDMLQVRLHEGTLRARVEKL